LVIEEDVMSEPGDDHAIREAAYFIWEQEGRPEGRAIEHWLRAMVKIEGSNDELLDEQEKIMANLPADLPAVLTKDAHGG
jgi:hypothetical protein